MTLRAYKGPLIRACNSPLCSLPSDFSKEHDHPWCPYSHHVLLPCPPWRRTPLVHTGEGKVTRKSIHPLHRVSSLRATHVIKPKISLRGKVLSEKRQKKALPNQLYHWSSKGKFRCAELGLDSWSAIGPTAAHLEQGRWSFYLDKFHIESLCADSLPSDYGTSLKAFFFLILGINRYENKLFELRSRGLNWELGTLHASTFRLTRSRSRG